MAALRSSVESFSETDSGLTPLGEALTIQRKINELLKQGMGQTEATAEATRLLSGDLAANSVLLQARLAAERKITDELTKQAKVRKPEDMRGFSTGAIPIPQASPVTQDYLKALGKIDLQIAQITEKQRLMNELGLSENVAQQAAKIATTLKLTDDQFALLVQRLKELEGVKKPVEDINKSIQSVGETIASSFESAFKGVMEGTKSVGQAFREMVGQIISELASQALKDAFKNLTPSGSGSGSGIWNLIGRGVEVLTSLIPGGGAEPGYSAGGMMAPNGLTPLAKGGYASATRPYLIGEEGPELWIPSASGRVVPNDEIGGSGSQINQTFNVSTGVQQTVRAEIMSMMPEIKAASTQAVLDARRRGGSFAGSFR